MRPHVALTDPVSGLFLLPRCEPDEVVSIHDPRAATQVRAF